MGLEDIMMMVNINPSQDMFDESQHVLNFSAVAKEILVEEQPKIVRQKKKNRFSQYLERNTASVQPIKELEEEEDERDIEINRLKMVICDLYSEIENKNREFKIEQKMEREHIISCYKNLIRELNEAKNESITEMKRECEELRKLNSYYSSLLKDGEDVINIDSSSEDEDSSPKKSSKEKREDLEEIISEQNNKIKTLQQELCEVKCEKEQLEKEIQVVPKLKEQIRVLREEETNLKLTLREAEEAYSELQLDIQEEKVKTKKLLSENLQLKERVEYLEEQLLL